VRVRMAIHTDDFLLRDAGNYFGPTIIPCARLRSLAVGNQILVSSTTLWVVADAVAPEIEFHDLGSHRLRDSTVRSRCGNSSIPTSSNTFRHPKCLHRCPRRQSTASE
jgi:class 3 adenylate cyclase